MAIFPKTKGTSQPVFALDTANGSIAGATSLAGLPVQPQGPKLDFFSLTANASINTSGNTNGYVGNVISSIQQLATVAVYQVDGQQISLAIYPTGAYTAATLVVQAQLANAAIGITAANVGDVGFKLATS
jgi:hypothetical protein